MSIIFTKKTYEYGLSLTKAVIRGILRKSCYLVFRKIHRKTPVSGSLFIKVASLRAG